MHLSRPLFCGTALAGLLFSSNAHADAGHTGFEALAKLTVPIALTTLTTEEEFDIGYDTTSSDALVGINGTLSFGYRFKFFGVYLEQDLGGVWDTSSSDGEGGYYDYDDDYGPDGPEEKHFIGGTYLMMRGIIPLHYDEVELDFSAGAGALYGQVIDAAFAIKVGASISYFFTSEIGVGISIDYSLGMDFSHKGGTLLTHEINPGLLARYHF